jgi:hypothetical protein
MDELHHQVRLSVGRVAGVEQPGDTGMIERSQNAAFPQVGPGPLVRGTAISVLRARKPRLPRYLHEVYTVCRIGLGLALGGAGAYDQNLAGRFGHRGRVYLCLRADTPGVSFP